MATHTVDDLLTLHEPNTYEFRVIFVSVSHAGGGAAPLDVRITVDQLKELNGSAPLQVGQRLLVP